jgi:hypothetical protein
MGSRPDSHRPELRRTRSTTTKGAFDDSRNDADPFAGVRVGRPTWGSDPADPRSTNRRRRRQLGCDHGRRRYGYEANFGDHIHVGDIADVSVFPKADVVIGVSLARRIRREIPAS